METSSRQQASPRQLQYVPESIPIQFPILRWDKIPGEWLPFLGPLTLSDARTTQPLPVFLRIRVSQTPLSSSVNLLEQLRELGSLLILLARAVFFF